MLNFKLTPIYWLLFGRVLQGFGFASACGVSSPSISDVFAGAELIKAYSYTGMAMAITPVVAPVIGFIFLLLQWEKFLLGRK